MKKLATLLAAAWAAGTCPALAQDSGAPDDDPVAAEGDEESVFDGDWLALGVGAGYAPGYDGSDNYVLYPQPLIAGSLGGIGISPRSGGAALDLLDGTKQGRISFSFGPVARLRSNRANQVKDPVVLAAGELDKAFEIGPSGGVTLDRLFHDYDRISLGVDVRWDVAGAHRGMVVDPGVSYFTPLSRGMALGLSAGAVWVDRGYADYYYSVSPTQSAASGLPQFTAGSGWDKAGGNVALGIDLDGSFENGGFAIGLGGGYSRMLGDAKRTPYTSLRGDADQWSAVAGIGYIF